MGRLRRLPSWTKSEHGLPSAARSSPPNLAGGANHGPAVGGTEGSGSLLQPQQIGPRAFLGDLDVALYRIIADHIGVLVARLARRHRRELRRRAVQPCVI